MLSQCKGASHQHKIVFNGYGVVGVVGDEVSVKKSGLPKGVNSTEIDLGDSRSCLCKKELVPSGNKIF